MAKANANEKNIKEKLKYLDLDLENIPEFLMQYGPLEYRVANISEDREQIVYKYVPINKIQLLITPETKNENLKKRYSEALPLHRYLKMDQGEEVERYTMFLNMLNHMSIDEIEEIEEEQEKLNAGIPFRIKYKKSYLWQIYYSQITDTYFMLLPIQDLEYNYLFYLLKKQIEFSKSKSKTVPKIYVPISHLEYSRERLNKTDIKDIENYLWLFTGEWANTYEVYDKKNSPSIQIVGETKVYDGIKTQYKIKLSNKEEAITFYKEVKALFILKTELSQYYKFDVKINKDSILEFYYNDQKLSFETLPQFIKSEYQKVKQELIKKKETAEQLEKILQKMRIDSVEKEREYLEKEKQISTFLEYKKTFFGKIKYFFKGKKTEKNVISSEELQVKNDSTKKPENDILEEFIQEKDTYTIEDLVIIYSAYDKKLKKIKNLEIDIDALELKIKNLERKIKNATIYIEEIEEHKKSIFEFWKFANKDEILSLVEGNTINNQTKKIRKVFNYEFDFEDLGNRQDKVQREKLTKEEQNSIYIANTEVLEAINAIRKPNKESEKSIKKILKNLKDELNTEVIGKMDFDIFGSITEDNTKIKTIANKHHREIEKNRLLILDINQATKEKEFQEKLIEVDANIKESLNKIKSPYDMSIYKIVKEEEKSLDEIAVYHLNSTISMEKTQYKDEKEIILYKVNIKENMPILFSTNIIYYDNNNKTLPLGMNISDQVIIDENQYEFVLKEKTEFKTNEYCNNKEDDAKLAVKTVTVYEYDARLIKK